MGCVDKKKNTRTFCHLCGTNLTFQVLGGNLVFLSLTTGNLEAGAAMNARQRAHVVQREALTE